MQNLQSAYSDGPIMKAVHDLEPQIRQAADRIEAERRLPDDLAHALMEAGVFRMGVPHEYGGSECDPMTQVRVVEELSRIEGSVGWLSMISSAGTCMAGYVEPRTAQRLFGPVESVVAGQVRPPQRADMVEGGFRLSGTFHFASGSQFASIFVCGCTVYENGQPRLHRSGQPEFRAMLVPRAKVRIVDVWDTTGMRGTGSNDFVVDNVFIPSDESATMFERPYVSSPLYRWAPIYLVSHAGVPLGIARSTLDFVEELSERKEVSPKRLMKDDPPIQESIAWAEAHLGAARSYVYTTLENLWQTLCDGGKPSPRQRAEYRMMLTYSHQAARQVISTLYDLAGTSSIFHRNPIDRNMRDIITACQHRVVHLKMYRPAGRLLLGLEPEEALF